MALLDFSAFERALDKLESTFERPTDFTHQPVEDWIVEVEREQFATQGAAGASGSWQPLAPGSVSPSFGPRRGGILERTGAMRDLLTRPDSLRDLMEVSGDRITFRLPEPASFHQHGTSRMPAREVFAPTEGRKRDLGPRVKKAATDEMRRRGVRVKS
jgi:hypothetical protein